MFDVLFSAQLACPSARRKLPGGMGWEAVCIGVHGNFLKAYLETGVRTWLIAERLECFDKSRQRVFTGDWGWPVSERTWVGPPPLAGIACGPGNAVVTRRLEACDAVACLRDQGKTVFDVIGRHRASSSGNREHRPKTANPLPLLPGHLHERQALDFAQ